MKFRILVFASILLINLASCKRSTDYEIVMEKPDTLETVVDDTMAPTYIAVDGDSLFQIILPSNMLAQTDLNADASLQYAYMAEVNGVVKEHYVIVITDTKEEIASYDLAVEFDAMTFSLASVESVVAAYDTYEILTAEPEVDTINQMDCVIYEIEAAAGEVETYHMLAVFEGKKAFYQVLTWTLLEQKDEFKPAMIQMIESFREI